MRIELHDPCLQPDRIRQAEVAVEGSEIQKDKNTDDPLKSDDVGEAHQEQQEGDGDASREQHERQQPERHGLNIERPRLVKVKTVASKDRGRDQQERGGAVKEIVDEFQDEDIGMRDRFRQVKDHLGGPVEGGERDNNVPHVDGEKKDKQEHRNVPVQEEQAQPLGVEQIVDRHPCQKVRRDGKAPEDQ